MLKKENRLNSVSLKNPRQLSTSFFNIRISKNEENINRFAFIVSKKVDRRATARNEVKRKVRSCTEEIFDNMNLGNDLIFYPKTAAIEAPREKILAEVVTVLKKEGILK